MSMGGVGIRMERSSIGRDTTATGVPSSLYFLQLMIGQSALSMTRLAESSVEARESRVSILLERVLLIRVLVEARGGR